MSKLQEEFKKRLIDELNFQEISNKEFAQKVGISNSTLSMYLYRGSIPAADVAVKMAEVLHTTTEYLILGIDKNNPNTKQSTKSDWQKRELTNIANSLSSTQLDNFLEIARAFKNAVSNHQDFEN
ncbi:helix-turn-helix domain-containing protein [Treponema sp. C6A8]|uniref:helix-turn-helix domain-containing protein n=1 Tax=Treponema sp. C6A8 TaxID=1410609 RepID=UPI000488A4E8|nr:helix-turn-helix transcriptional regulator [Treponema sp. C6A8]